MTSGREVYHNVPALIELGGKGSVNLVSQSLKYPHAQLFLRWLPIAGVRGTGAVIADPQYRSMTRQCLQGYFKA